FDPDVWSGRALQEDFVELAAAVLHQCIRPLIGACCAPGHHGYQRACVLISGQTSIGPFGSPVFARARKTDPPFCLVLSQTSAGTCWVKSAGSAAGRTLPVFPTNRTYSVPVGMSQTCQERKCTDAGGLTPIRWKKEDIRHDKRIRHSQ